MIETKGKKIVISADDFGISRTASEKILELVKAEKIDRVAVMMSENITEEQVKTLLDSGVKIDVHFHLAGEKINSWQNRKEEYKEGDIKRIIIFLWAYFFSRGRIREAEAEWYFQLGGFRKIFKKDPDGVSSHEHIHFFPAYFKIMMEIASQNNIEFVRFGKNNYKKFGLVSFILNSLRFFDYKYFKELQPKLKTTDFFVSFDWIKDYNNFFGSIPAGKVVELVFHPERPEEFKFLKENY
jgi:predicted glycoside hydrolase/deacetylase ChbG (UPF0249 family)